MKWDCICKDCGINSRNEGPTFMFLNKNFVVEV